MDEIVERIDRDFPYLKFVVGLILGAEFGRIVVWIIVGSILYYYHRPVEETPPPSAPINGSPSIPQSPLIPRFSLIPRTIQLY